MAISDSIPKQRCSRYIFSDKDYPKFILMNPNILPPCGYFSIQKKQKQKTFKEKI